MYLRKKTKMFSLLLVSVLLVTSLGTNVSAATESIGSNQQLVKVEKNASKDSLVMDLISSSSGELRNVETGETLDLKVESTNTQVVNDSFDFQSNTSDRQETANEAAVTKPTEYKADVVIAASVPMTKADYKDDASLAVRVYMTIYYTLYPSGTFNYAGITKISYRFENYDSSVSVENKKIQIGQAGIGISGTTHPYDQYVSRNALTSETILVSGFGWESVLWAGLGTAVAATVSADLHRGTSSSWSLTFQLVIT